MSVKYVNAKNPPDLARLSDEIADEYRLGTHGQRPDLQIIVEELPAHRQYVTVIWEGLRNVPASTRGKVILEAIRQASGEEAVLSTSIALGLTPDEAQRLGVG